VLQCVAVCVQKTNSLKLSPFRNKQTPFISTFPLPFSSLQCVAVCRKVLQCVAVCCSVLQCVYRKQTVSIYLLLETNRLHLFLHFLSPLPLFSVLQCVAVCRKVLLCVCRKQTHSIYLHLQTNRLPLFLHFLSPLPLFTVLQGVAVCLQKKKQTSFISTLSLSFPCFEERKSTSI